MAVDTLTPTLVKNAYEPAATAVVDLDRLYEVDSATLATSTFALAAGDGNQTARFPAGKRFRIAGSTAGDNDGIFTVVSSAFGAVTSIVVVEAVADGADGFITVGAFEPAAIGGDTNDFESTEHELVIVRNVHASAAKTFTAPSVANARGRFGAITAHSLKAGEMAFLPYFKRDGWTTGTTIALTGEDANIEFAVVRLPR